MEVTCTLTDRNDRAKEYFVNFEGRRFVFHVTEDPLLIKWEEVGIKTNDTEGFFCNGKWKKVPDCMESRAAFWCLIAFRGERTDRYNFSAESSENA